MHDLVSIGTQMDELTLKPHVESLEEIRDSVDSYLSLFKEERQGIASARGAGELHDQAASLGALANCYFDVYGVHFSGLPRVSRRPELLERIVAGLKQTLDSMESLRSVGMYAEFNEENIKVVKDKLGLYASEIELIRSTRSGLSAQQLSDHLGHAANRVVSDYTKLDSDAPDKDVLAGLCDRLREVERQMRAIQTEKNLTANGRNLMLVVDTLDMFQRQFDKLTDDTPSTGS